MSMKTYALRDIVMMLDEARGNLEQSLTTLAKELEANADLEKLLGDDRTISAGSSSYRATIKALKDGKTQLDIGLFRFNVALERLEKGAVLEEEKVRAQKKSEEH